MEIASDHELRGLDVDRACFHIACEKGANHGV